MFISEIIALEIFLLANLCLLVLNFILALAVLSRKKYLDRIQSSLNDQLVENLIAKGPYKRRKTTSDRILGNTSI